MVASDRLLAQTRPTRMVAVAAMIGSAACWGFATVMSRDLLDSISAPGLLVVQLCASVMVLSLLTISERPGHYLTSALVRAALVGLFEPGLAYAVGLVGLSLTSAGHAAVISSAEPIFILLVGWVCFKQRPSRRLALCIAIAMAGLVLVSGEGGAVDGPNQVLGDLLIVAATMFAAGYVVLSARLVVNFPSATLAGAQQIVGLLFAIIVYGLAHAGGFIEERWQGIDSGILFYAAASGVVQYAIPFWLYLIGLRVLSAGAAGLYLALTPVFGVVGAIVWLGERPHALMLVGATLILFAVFAGRTEH